MDSNEILVKVEGVKKKYCKDLRRSLRYGLQELAGELFLRQRPIPHLRRHEFWALQDVNFELKRGEAFGIIGVNGSGKTTLLKIMQGLLKPTEGTVTIKGRVGALISLGAGFQPLLTGRENIYVNAAILRVPMRQVDKRLTDILNFAELGDFIDAPIKTYSSGMRGRLGFAIATHLIEPDVLLLDEVLATGDWKFKDRCFRRMEEIVSSGATVIFVSHLLPKVEKFCNRAMLLHKGVVKGVGPAAEVCQMYYDLPEVELPPNPKDRRRQLAKLMRQQHGKGDEPGSAEASASHPSDRNPAASSGTVSSEDVLAIELLDQDRISQTVFRTLDTLIVQIYIALSPLPPKLKVVVQLLTPGDEISVSHFLSTFSLIAEQQADVGMHPAQVADHSIKADDPIKADHPIKIECTIPELSLRAGKYRVSVTVTPLEPESAQPHQDPSQASTHRRQKKRSRFTSTVTLLVQDKLEPEALPEALPELSPEPSLEPSLASGPKSSGTQSSGAKSSGAKSSSTKKSPGLVYMPVNWAIATPTAVHLPE